MLIVEDDQGVIDAMRVLFESMDRRVAAASTLAGALRVAREDPARLVLLDVTLPDGDGLSIVGELQAAGCETVIALTGHDDPETKARGLAAGCADVWVKPVPIRELLRKSQQWLG